MRSSSHASGGGSHSAVPHNGALCRTAEDGYETQYVVAIEAGQAGYHELLFTRSDLSFAQRLFSILDTESRGFVDRAKVQEFTTLRCPVFWRRDDDLRKLSLATSSTSHDAEGESPTFCEIWDSVVACSRVAVEGTDARQCELGLEGWMVFCRFIALAQYLEAKRRFSARHLQQTMRNRNSPRGSEVVMVEVPPPEPPAALSPEQLAAHEQRNKSPLPNPELDLDHSLLAAHDSMRRRPTAVHNGRVKIDLFGCSAHQHSGANLEFAVTFTRPPQTSIGVVGGVEQTIVRRTISDMKWLDETVTSYKALGGTLCGRILPPFPHSGNRGKILSRLGSDDSLLSSSIKNTSGAIAVAAAGVGKIKDVARSFFGSYLDFGTSSAQLKSGSGHGAAGNLTKASASQKKASKHVASTALPESYYNPNSPDGKARQIERYLNYLLDHPALSTSFPLNAVLTASQSGLEAAKMSLEECQKAAKELRDQTPQLDDGGSLFVPMWLSNSSGDANSCAPDFAWVRTAAQAAMALQVHGMLETTGMPSASARLQHASLPSFGRASNQGTAWDDDSVAGGDSVNQSTSENRSVQTEGHGFEDGVVSVQSELRSQVEPEAKDDGYDLLPLPVPAPERRILTAGNTSPASPDQTDSRFHYGTAADVDFSALDSHDDESSVVLGNMLVDDNIDKLREVIGSVDNTLSRCLGSSGGIGTARREKLRVQLDIIRGLDSWEGMRGQFVSQRALLRGVGGMSQSSEIYEESDLILVDDLSWQANLAHSAVGAAEDVRSAIRASRTAANAKAAANSAAMSAQSACSNNFATMEEARAAQTRSSIAQSHAIHAAVVDHEAKAVKRRATLALAHDVKCWNVHRKRELLQSCLSYARSQHEATRRAVDAWSTLRDGFIGSHMVAHDRRVTPLSRPPQVPAPVERPRPTTDPGEVIATIFDSPNRNGEPAIVASEHELLTPSELPLPTGPPEVDENWGELPMPIFADPTSPVEPAPDGQEQGQTDAESPLPDQTDPDIPWQDMQEALDQVSSMACDTDEKTSDVAQPDFELPFATASLIAENEDEVSGEPALLSASSTSAARGSPGRKEGKGEETLSESMQSLVDGLMSWGGGIDADEMALPAGMAASILEESLQ